MHIQSNETVALKDRLNAVKAAFEQGELDDYAPLSQSGHHAMHATCATAWGPAMRR